MGSVIAYFDSSHDLAEEIIMAAGKTPYKILGDVNVSNNPADKYLFETFCPAARSMLTEALHYSEKWEGIIIAHGCDATHRQFDIWKKHVQNPFIYFVNNPLSRVSKSGRDFYRTELQTFIEALEKQYNVNISNEKLQNAIKISNQVKKLLQNLGKLREFKDIPNHEYFNICKIAVQEDKKSVIPLLERKLSEWGTYSAFPTKFSRILLTGSDVNYPEFMNLLDKAKLRVVRDDLSIGERYYTALIPEMQDPLDALIEYQYLIPRPATKHPAEPRLDFLLRAYESSHIEGILSQNLKFCETYAFDSVWLSNTFKQKNIPSIHLERDFIAEDQQLFTRLEVFKELLNSKRRI
ncbi:MAG: 2-hydroxyacyl-CoA dehydratase [Candidatus Lokiarchaeota archaeon]|nr:2-hydroxyacyl-CoA dehydratase [Candidatus Lokiarchaeota archaeon]